jgi:ABC-type antimicrobial peptide transport system permease subunit
MFKNYFITACRNFWRNKIFSLIHILGLSIGISAALVIFLVVYYEFSFDRFEQDKDRIYHVILDASFNGEPGHSAAVPAPLGNAIQNEVTGIEQTVPVFQFPGDATAKVSVIQISSDNPVAYKKQKEIVFVDKQYFRLLNYKWIVGSPESSAQNPFNVVLTENRAHQYFPSLPLNAIVGKQITYNDDIRTTVSGIVKDLNENTAFSATDFISISTILHTNLKDQLMMTVWNDWMAYSQLYVKTLKGISREGIELQIKKLFKKYNKDGNNGNLNTTTFRLQPLAEMHFDSNYPSVGKRIANKQTLYGLVALASFLLLLGCINFINLSSAQASQRAKEIGIRKTMGSSKTQLIEQFLGETFFITAIATLVSLLLTPLLLKLFADFTPQGLRLDLLHQPWLILFLLVLTFLVSFLAGLYPALVISGYNPVSALKNQAFVSSSGSRSAWLRKTLTVSQFVIAQFFVICSLLVSKQIDYSLNKDLGFQKDAILTFETPFDTVAIHGTKLLNEINAMPQIALASTGFFSPADAGAAYTNIQYKGKPDLKANVQLRWGDSNYLKLYQIKILAGRNVQHIDSFQEFLINETYAKLLGFQHPKDALNKQLSFNGKNLPIVGVMRDFHAESLHAAIGPIAFAGGRGSIFHIRLWPKDQEGKLWQTAIGKIQKAYKKIYPEADFKYAFLDETIANFYENEQRMSRLLLWATGLMIFISCLGLLGLVIFTTNRRTKEIGVRKILGASVASIVSILSKDFVKLVLIAFLIAVPAAWWSAYKWLEGYAYRTSISWWLFALTALLILLFALVTLSIQTIRAAIANPVKSLRTE